MEGRRRPRIGPATGGKHKLMSVFYTNCQSINNKRSELRAVLSELQPDMVLLTETWTNQTIENSILKIDGYELIMRKDRTDTAGGRGGGLLAYVKKGVNAWELTIESDFCQVGGVGLRGQGKVTNLYLVYRSPNSTNENDEKLTDWLKTLVGNYCVFGDFNFPGISWDDGRSDTKGRVFLETVESKFMTQHVGGSTHVGGHLLDLVLSSSENMVMEVERMRSTLTQSRPRWRGSKGAGTVMYYFSFKIRRVLSRQGRKGRTIADARLNMWYIWCKFDAT